MFGGPVFEAPLPCDVVIRLRRRWWRRYRIRLKDRIRTSNFLVSVTSAESGEAIPVRPPRINPDDVEHHRGSMRAAVDAGLVFNPDEVELGLRREDRWVVTTRGTFRVPAKGRYRLVADLIEGTVREQPHVVIA